MVTQLKIIYAKSGNVIAPKPRKNLEEVHKIEGRVAIPRAQGRVVRTSTGQDFHGFHLSFLFASFI